MQLAFKAIGALQWHGQDRPSEELGSSVVETSRVPRNPSGDSTGLEPTRRPRALLILLLHQGVTGPFNLVIISRCDRQDRRKGSLGTEWGIVAKPPGGITAVPGNPVCYRDEVGIFCSIVALNYIGMTVFPV